MAIVCQLPKLDHEELEFIPHQHLDTFDHLRNSEQLVRDMKDDPEGLFGAAYTFTDPLQSRITVTIARVLSCAEGTSGRSSVVAEVACVCSANGCLTSGCEWHGESKIMKISFESSTQEPEPDLIFKAREMARSTGNDWALKHLPNIVHSVTIKYSENYEHGRLKAHLKNNNEERVMHVTFYEKLQPLSEFGENLPKCFMISYKVRFLVLKSQSPGLTRLHFPVQQWLYECAGILHHDLSIGNIMFRRIEGKVYGVLNDFDLSSTVDCMAQGPSSKERTGTRPFMSPDLLDSHWKGGHLPRHDLESLFYIILCLVCRYDELYGLIPCAEPRPFTKWFVGSDDDVRAYKVSFIHYGSAPTIQPYFTDFKPWVTDLRYCLFNGYYHRPPLESDPEILASQFALPCAVDYDWDTLGGIITYHNFRLVMSTFRGVPLETRWQGFKPEN
ncbi:protein kinase [Lentinula raphanica]|uniref:Protein kinase n=1 Tax=Lentinula raphanica TaxID=153919 RepID=A0AA38UFG1_9AGAR|nr:protein kinase [Lentinula raphanica]